MYNDLSQKHIDLTTKYNQVINTNANQRNDIQNLSRKYNDLSQKHIDLAAKYNQVVNTNANQNNDIQHLQTSVTELRHVEHGEIQCGDSDLWTDGVNSGWKYKTVVTSFSRSYSTNPAVFLSVVEMNDTEDDVITFYAALISSSTSGFTMRCETPANLAKKVSMTVTWISIPT